MGCVTDPKPKAVADVDSNFSAQIKTVQQQATAQQQAVTYGLQAKWLMPTKSNWSGDLFDFVAMAAPFDRSQSNNWLIQAIADANNPGTSGDLVVTQTQVDYLACLERSFRARHTMRRPRAMAHAMGRKMGHGSDTGPLVQNVLEYVRGLVNMSKGGG